MSAEFNWFPGHMNKTLKNIEEKIPVVDLVIEILDARAPYSSRNLTFSKILKNKPILYVLSKADIADPNITKEWVEFYEKKNNTVMVLDDKQKNIVKPLIDLINKATKEKQEKDKAKGMVNSLINVLVIGIPNVGKSTFINRLIKNKSVKAGNKPGLTRGIQLIHLSQFISLLDTPGVLPAKLENETVATNICAINSIKEDVYPKERVAGKLMQYLFNHYEGLIENHYKISPRLQRPIQITDTFIIFEMIAKVRKWYMNDDLLDYDRVIDAFMRDIIANEFNKVSFERILEVVPEEMEKASKIKNEKAIEDISDLW
ncbi:predicted GTPase [Mesoplasma florum L1]|uniref:Ribosome biogenesis GTPase A n=1 Tax=Mesoplasma florum (strain ATCC 33453 / NBRC 100688 / NCTC 11704 / L1) TaxID=265311 RepID=Q6F0S7_MESFL|nr:ribosome biogenesis GTPase YlqF [Mesoplasma florum]AAT75896.1 predicted GTPase [Mesoplasma florum L1]ATI73503.1 ribosome biogenesis GTPase YlqF [Mesoplasma florum]AVN61200.1 ribosome biogenesis GTPase YlqF [Mesoplasma florum]AVN61896.1 ribosome biogenesis GTPase YlqF [Mesoplasma florum]